MMLLSLLIMTLVLLGFGYIVWVLASKEAGLVKMGGQILAALLIICVLVMFVLALVNGGRMKSMCGMGPMRGGMMKGQMMEKMMDKEKGAMMMEKMKGQRKMMKEGCGSSK